MGVLLGLLAGITYGAADFIGGLASRRSSTFSVVIISQLSGLVVLLALLPLLPALRLPMNQKHVPCSIANCVCSQG